MENHEPSNLESLLDALQGAEDSNEDSVSVDDLVEATGRRSFGPLLLVAGMLVASPLSGIPGFPTLSALIVLLIATQLLLGRSSFWLPQWLLRRELDQSKVDSALKFLRPPARWIDKLLKPRLSMLTRGVFVYAIGALCALLAIAMPPLEMVPMASSIVGAVLAAFGLGLIAHDGLLIVLALALCTGTAAWLIFGLF